MPTGSVYNPLEVYRIIKAENDKRGGKGDVITATAIVLRESGGNATAYRDASQNRLGGNDRGWWQFNSKAHPDVSDIVAYDPIKSTAVAYDKSKGFTDWTPWYQNGALRFDGKQAEQAVTNAKAAGAMDGMTDSFNWSDVPDIARDALDSVTPGWMDSLAAILSNVLDPDFWKRVGLVVLGALIIIAGLMLFFGVSPTDMTPAGAIKEVAT